MATDSITRQGRSVVPFRVPAGRSGRPPGPPPGELVVFHPRGGPPAEDDPTPHELFRRWLEASERTRTPPPGPIGGGPREALLRWRRAMRQEGD